MLRTSIYMAQKEELIQHQDKQIRELRQALYISMTEQQIFKRHDRLSGYEDSAGGRKLSRQPP